MRTFIIMSLFLSVLLSCKNSKESASSSENDKKIADLEKEYNTTKVDSTFNKLMQQLGQAVVSNDNMMEKELLLSKAISMCQKPEHENMKEVLGTELMKVNPKGGPAKDFLYTLAEKMLNRNKKEVASILFSGFKSRYASDPRSKECEKYILTEQKDMNAYLHKSAEQVFENPGEQGINIENTQKYIDVCESFALAFPYDPMAPEYLFRAAEMARGMGSLPKMMSLYDWIYTYFPTYKKANMALFLKGFAMDTNFKRPEEARKIYEKFLQKHPQDSLAKDVKFLLKNLGKSDAELLKEIEKSKKN
ncbi:MAG: hypothetical protein IPN89_09490 [Saprospiraceae bacterium]|nr:hypothetical protein [Saprospiraceae bacterium]